MAGPASAQASSGLRIWHPLAPEKSPGESDAGRESGSGGSWPAEQGESSGAWAGGGTSLARPWSRLLEGARAAACP